MASDKCNSCKAFNSCLTAVLNGSVMRCIHFENIRKSVNETVDALSSIGLPNPLTKDEIKDLIYRSNEMGGVL